MGACPWCDCVGQQSRAAGWMVGLAVVCTGGAALPRLWTPAMYRENWRAASHYVTDYQRLALVSPPRWSTMWIIPIARWNGICAQAISASQLPVYFPYGGTLRRSGGNGYRTAAGRDRQKLGPRRSGWSKAIWPASMMSNGWWSSGSTNILPWSQNNIQPVLNSCGLPCKVALASMPRCRGQSNQRPCCAGPDIGRAAEAFNHPTGSP